MEVDMQTLRDTALQAITDIAKEGKLEDVTQRSFRKKVAELMSLEPGALNGPEYKSVVSKVVQDYLAAREETDEQPREGEVAKKKRKSITAEDKPKAQSAKSTKAKPHASKLAESKAALKKVGKKPARSASVIPSSEDEAQAQSAAESKAKPRKKQQPAAAKRVESNPELDEPAGPAAERQRTTSSPRDDEVGGPSTSSAGVQAAKSTEVGKHDAEDGQKSESEMSVLDDEQTPAPMRKKKGENGAPRGEKGTKGRKRKEPAKEPSKDEETIKRLKSLVVACGIRKVWSKEFKTLDKPSEQIRRLRQILTDLGMTGRMSVEQAKAIKAKREFEKELEDVQEFAQKMESTGQRGGQKAAVDQEDVLDDSDVEIPPKRRRITARQSIMAFLGDEDESE